MTLFAFTSNTAPLMRDSGYGLDLVQKARMDPTRPPFIAPEERIQADGRNLRKARYCERYPPLLIASSYYDCMPEELRFLAAVKNCDRKKSLRSRQSSMWEL